ncbi:hypothetical protein [Candidatus Soleaferrea massiliensis]|uniref:hypothetical protein n=1 Tax=Candidatus Soleaferrea massiliensis TaxID=1470354 RepID=UPI00059172DE|nr:hypothetical protein [Candidatus Soleaferrea massiliensis]
MKRIFACILAAALLSLSLTGCAEKEAYPTGGTSVPEKQQTALENCLEYIQNASFEGKDTLDTEKATFQHLTPELIQEVWIDVEGIPELDENDYLFTIGDTSTGNYMMIVCESDSNEVIGYIPVSK